MRRSFDWSLRTLLMLSAVGCTFSSGAPGGHSAATGTSGVGSGNAGSSGVGTSTGAGLTGGDVTGAAGKPTAPSVDANCGQVNNPLKVIPPDILIIQDKSSSMSNDDSDKGCANGGCGANSKWSQVTAALNQVVMNTQMTVNWGLKFFSDNGACAGVAAPVVPVAPANSAAIAAAIAKTSPGGNTPTRDAVTSGASYLGGLTDTNPKYLLLATDGLPNCPVGCAAAAKPSGMCTMTDNPSEDAAAEQAIATASGMGFKVFVVGIGNVSTAVATLNQMAINGSETQTGAATSYYAATDPTSLETALNAIVGKVASCTLTLPNKPQVPSNVIVEDIGTKTVIPQDTSHANGWDYTDTTDTAIQLYGPACTDVTNGTYTNIEILEGCPGLKITLS